MYVVLEEKMTVNTKNETGPCKLIALKKSNENDRWKFRVEMQSSN